MPHDPLQILVVEDNYFLAMSLAENIRANGDRVIGPFPDVHEAIHHIEHAGAAILDILVGDDTSFDIADCLVGKGTPFLFYTGADRRCVPPRLGHAKVIAKPCNPRTMVDVLHRMHSARRWHEEPKSVLDLLPHLRMRAREAVHDVGAADRLVGAALEQAIAANGAVPEGEDIGSWLLHLLEQELVQFQRRLI